MVHSLRKLVQSLAHFLNQFFCTVLSDIDVLFFFFYFHLFFAVDFRSPNNFKLWIPQSAHILYEMINSRKTSQVSIKHRREFHGFCSDGTQGLFSPPNRLQAWMFVCHTCTNTKHNWVNHMPCLTAVLAQHILTETNLYIPRYTQFFVTHHVAWSSFIEQSTQK